MKKKVGDVMTSLLERIATSEERQYPTVTECDEQVITIPKVEGVREKKGARIPMHLKLSFP